MIEGFVYFAKSGGPDGFIKIGFSRTPEVRLKALQTGSGYSVTPICVLPGTSSHERHLHRVLSEHRIIGEWFAACQPVQDAIDSAKAGHWYGFINDEQEGLSEHAEKASEIASYLKSAAEFAGLWSLKKGADYLVFGLSPWKIWKFFYQKMEPTVAELELLVHAKKAAASTLLSLAQDAFDEADIEINLLEEERATDSALIGELETLSEKFDAYFASKGIERPKITTTPEEDAAFRIEFEAELKRKEEKRAENLLAKIAERKSA